MPETVRRRPLALVGAGLGAILAAGTVQLATPAPVAEAQAAPTGIVMTARPVLLETPHRHSAFPGLALHPDGHLSEVHRGASDHADSRNGAIMRSESYNAGKTWTPATVMLDTPKDERDPYLSVIDGHEYLTWFTGSTALAAEGAYVSRDGGPPVRIDQLPYAAVSGPVVKLPDGRLGVAYYGRKAGELVDTAWMAWSSDLGATWSSNRIMNAIGAGLSTAEPWLVVDGSTIHMFARWGSTQIAVRSSSNSGVSGSWTDTRVAITGCNGRPSTLLTAAGSLVMVCRDARGGSGARAQVAYSLNHGATWAWGPTALPSPAGSFGMVYSAMAETAPGVILLIVAMENPDGSSDLYITRLAEAVSWLGALAVQRINRGTVQR